MREITSCLRFTTPSLGNKKAYVKNVDAGGKAWPVYYMPRVINSEAIRFESSWWLSGLRYASQVLCHHQSDIQRISFDVAVDGQIDTNVQNFYRRYLPDGPGKFVRHEAFKPGDIVMVHCVVPDAISDADFEALLNIMGRFRGISPYRQKQEDYGKFTVESCKPVRNR